MSKVIYKDLSFVIVGMLFEVFNELGYGYQEKYYEKALEKLFKTKGVKYKRQAPYKINFKSERLGTYFIDFIIEDKIVLELKKGKIFSRKNIAQVNGYLKATGMQLAILANFIPEGVKFKRMLNIKGYKQGGI